MEENVEQHILIIDDDEFYLDMLKDDLYLDGYHVLTASNADEARSILKSERVDLALIDISLNPDDLDDETGLALAKEISPRIPKVIMSTITSAEKVRKAVAPNLDGPPIAVDFFGKSEPYERLLASIRTHTGQGKSNMLKEALKVFISYKWEDDSHNKWVEKFATDLRAAGINAILDRWEVRFGDSFTDYMTSKIAEADVVVFIMTSRSVAAAEAPTGEGGAVKFEMQMATSRRIAGEKMRLIGVYREGNQTVAHLRDHKYADFRDDLRYKANIQELIDDLLGKEKRPPLGTTINNTVSPESVALSPEAKRLLSQATLDQQGFILMMATFGGLTIQTNSHNFAETGNPRSEAKWRSVIQELIRLGYIEQHDQKGEVFRVTNAGYEAGL